MPEVIESRRQALIKPLQHQQSMDTGITPVSTTANPSPSSASSIQIPSTSAHTPTSVPPAPTTPNSIIPKVEPITNSVNGPERPGLNALRTELDILNSAVTNGPNNLTHQQITRSSSPVSNANSVNPLITTQSSNHHTSLNTSNHLNQNQSNHIQNGNIQNSNSSTSTYNASSSNNLNSTRSSSPYLQGGNVPTSISAVYPINNDTLLNSPSKNGTASVASSQNGSVFNNTIRSSTSNPNQVIKD